MEEKDIRRVGWRVRKGAKEKKGTRRGKEERKRFISIFLWFISLHSCLISFAVLHLVPSLIALHSSWCLSFRPAFTLSDDVFLFSLFSLSLILFEFYFLVFSYSFAFHIPQLSFSLLFPNIWFQYCSPFLSLVSLFFLLMWPDLYFCLFPFITLLSH